MISEEKKNRMFGDLNPAKRPEVKYKISLTLKLRYKLGLVNFPKIPSVCLCGCNEIIWSGKEYIRGHHSKINHPNKNKHLSLECRNKQSKSLKGRSCWCRGKHLSQEHKDKISKNHAILPGELNPNWNGGSSFGKYCSKFNSKLKREIRIRDNYICQLCGKTQIQQRTLLSIHHIHYDRENCYPDLICLCLSCNSKVNKKNMRKYFESLFMNKLNNQQFLFWIRRREL